MLFDTPLKPGVFFCLSKMDYNLTYKPFTMECHMLEITLGKKKK